ncbi:MAG: heparinase II/III family protein, partial [Sphaerochaetaceae bacterium]
MKREEYFSQWRICFLEDPRQVAKYVWQYEKKRAEAIIVAADQVVAQSFLFDQRWDMEQTSQPVVFPNRIDWLYQPADDNEWVYAFNRMRFWIALGQAYALTGNEQYAQTFASQLCDWVTNIKRSDSTCAKAWRSIEAGLRMEYWTKAMQYFKESPAVTEEVLEIFISSIAEHAEFLYSVWDSYHLMSNWGVLENHGLFLAALALPKSEISENYYRESLRRLALEIEIQVYDDGVHWEQSSMYHNEVLHCFLDVVLL